MYLLLRRHTDSTTSKAQNKHNHYKKHTLHPDQQDSIFSPTIYFSLTSRTLSPNPNSKKTKNEVINACRNTSYAGTVDIVLNQEINQIKIRTFSIKEEEGNPRGRVRTCKREKAKRGCGWRASRRALAPATSTVCISRSPSPPHLSLSFPSSLSRQNSSFPANYICIYRSNSHSQSRIYNSVQVSERASCDSVRPRLHGKQQVRGPRSAATCNHN